MWRRPLEWNLNGTTDPRDGSVDNLSLNSLKDRHGPIRASKSLSGKSGDDLDRGGTGGFRKVTDAGGAPIGCLHRAFRRPVGFCAPARPAPVGRTSSRLLKKHPVSL